MIEPDNIVSQNVFAHVNATLKSAINYQFGASEEAILFEEEHMHWIDDNMCEIAKKWGIEPREVLSRELEYRIEL